jgi:hypothetical protein
MVPADSILIIRPTNINLLQRRDGLLGNSDVLGPRAATNSNRADEFAINDDGDAAGYRVHVAQVQQI